MKLIVGLGNPGETYKNNRHNVGFMFVDSLAKQFSNDTQFKFDKYLQSEYLQLPLLPPTTNNQQPITSNQLILAKPQTFMNKSGEAVSKLLSRFLLSPTTNNQQPTTNLIVVHDDLDIPFGKFHIQVGRGPLLHNGLESIENHIKTKEFTRVRIGVDGRTPERKIDGETYVLQDFTNEELFTLQSDLFSKILAQLRVFFS